ncbi:Fe-S-cluster-containing hydrogenase [Candidatus Zixiibacteriota bacterium]|nr:Fe-S-cluster-containing hydrogenase [candidate division Zixibacteria bacterium]
MSDELKYGGKEYWRSFDQLAETPEFQELLHREFPEHAWELDNGMSRRNFLSLMGASVAMAGLAGCRRPVEKILPYVSQPEEIIPGVAQHYATTMPLGLNAYGLVVETHEGRPTKIEGNPLHPSTLGAASAIMQASILGMYDPDRSKRLLQKGDEKEWIDFVSFWRELYQSYLQNRGKGLAVLTESFASPTLAKLIETFRSQFPAAAFISWEPVSDENLYEGTKTAAGAYLQPVHYYDRARVILSLDSDFLQTEGENVAATRHFADGRRLVTEKDAMNRLYMVESNYSLTGGMADHRLRLASRHIGPFVMALTRELKTLGLAVGIDARIDYPENFFDKKWLNVVARDLLRSQGQSLLVAGRRQPSYVHEIVLALNHGLGNTGQTVSYRRAIDSEMPSTAALSGLVDSVNRGEIETLIILGGNPVYNAPVDLKFPEALKKAGHVIHLGLYNDETGKISEWHIPQSHYLESWGDARAADGTVSVIQPMIEPLYGGHSAVELLNLIVTGHDQGGYDIVRNRWSDILNGLTFESVWQKVLHDGLLSNSAVPPQTITLNFAAIESDINRSLPSYKQLDSGNMEVVFAASPAMFDGRFANIGWLQELPDSITKITWDNPVLISHRTAQALKVESGDLVQLEWQGNKMEAAVYVLPGHADNSVTLQLGYGQSGLGRIADGVGFDTYRLRQSQNKDFGDGLIVTKTGRTYKLSTTQNHQTMEGRPMVREGTIDEYRQRPNFAAEMVKLPLIESIFTEHKYDTGYQWGMTVDLNACTGCNACTIACQSENNIPIVGKEQVSRGREMHWIRNDRYFVGDTDTPEMAHQVVACQQCENAPCETVCPVAATVHDHEGLNVMTYNRCIGTRYCSNNCPYKVRRFNFFNYTNKLPQTIKMAQNPDVTVRFRGVMEKCTFCVQRIVRGKDKAKLEGREVRDGEIITACQQTCPAQAIVFGNINDPDSRVSQIKKSNRNYQILAELNTKPRNSYLARIRNPHPELENHKPVTG